MPSDPSPLLKIFARATEDLLAQPAVKSRLALLFRELAEALEPPSAEPDAERAAPPMEAETGLIPQEAALSMGDGVPAPPAFAPEAEPEDALDPAEARRLLIEGMGERTTTAPGVTVIERPATPPPAPQSDTAPPDVSLQTLSQRFKQKAEACKALCTAGSLPKSVAEWAKQNGTVLWMDAYLKPERKEWMEHLGLCFEAGAEAALLLERTFPFSLDVITHRHRDAIDAAAHVTSLMLSATFRMQGKNDLHADPDVRDLHRWLEFFTERHQIYQERYMKLNALAPLKSLDEARDKMVRLRDPRSKAERELLSGLKAYLKQIAAEAPDSPARRLRETRFLEKMETAKELGWQASRVDLRKLLSAWYDVLPRPEKPTPFYAQLLTYVDAQYSEIPADEPDEDEEELQPSKTPNIDRVRPLLAGKVLYIVGGNPVPAAMERIKKAFGLKEVIWPATNPSSSVEGLRATVFRPDVAAVLLLVRFSSHAFGQLIDDCERARKPFVRIPSGYGVKQIAYQILAQASQQLA